MTLVSPMGNCTLGFSSALTKCHARGFDALPNCAERRFY